MLLNIVKYYSCKINLKSEKGSLALEQVLFIGAVVALAAGLFTFYDNLSLYFNNIGFSESPTNFGGAEGIPE